LTWGCIRVRDMSVGVVAGTANDSQEEDRMPRQTRAAKKRAVEQRTQQRLTARKEAAQRGVETRRRNQEAKVKGQPAKARKQAPVAAQVAQPQEQQAPVAGRQTKRPERAVAQDKRAGGAMVTVALRGESAQRLRALAAAQEMSLSKLVVRMMELFEAQAG